MADDWEGPGSWQELKEHWPRVIEAIATTEERRDALDIAFSSLAAAHPRACMPKVSEILHDIPSIHVIGFGKASHIMLSELVRHYNGNIERGIINCPISGNIGNVVLNKASHPHPDIPGRKGAEAMMELVEGLSENDILVCLISGGGSAMLPFPRSGIELDHAAKLAKELMEAGADIHELNAVRRAISQVKGGRLAFHSGPAKVINLIISDVIGNHMEDIASGPTVHDPGRIHASDVLDKFQIEPTEPIRVAVESYSPLSNDELPSITNIILADNLTAVDAGVERARKLGYEPIKYWPLEGEAQKQAGKFVESGNCVIGGGETTVHVKGGGKGGRNQEFVLAAVVELEGTLLSIGTDGIDGNSQSAGAIADTSTKRLLDPGQYMEINDSNGYFNKVGGLVNTGPTGTNVSDVAIFLSD